MPTLSFSIKKPKSYDVQKWYWYVGGDTTKAYSSSASAFVPSTDATLAIWMSDGVTVPTKIGSASELGTVLASAQLRPADAAILDGYVNALTDQAITLFQILFGPNKLNHENRIRTCERAIGISSAPDLTAAQLKALIKGML